MTHSAALSSINNSPRSATRRAQCWLIASLLLSCCLPAIAQENYTAFELRRADNWAPLRLEDMNGDGRLDIVSPGYRPGLGRELHIYHQQPNGNFSPDPQQVEIKTEIIAVGFADLRSDPGQELVLFANSGIFSLSTTREGYTDNLKLLTQWDYLATIPDLESVRFVNHLLDINNDGQIDMLVPGDDEYGVFLGSGDEQFQRQQVFSTVNADLTPIQRRSRRGDLEGQLAINAESGVQIALRVETPTPFQGFVEQWPNQDEAAALLDDEQWMPTATVAQLNADGLADITYINAGDNGLGQMHVHFQDADSGFSADPDWSQAFDSSGDLQLTDLDGDGLDDLLRISDEGSDWTVRLYRNQDGQFRLDAPNQVLRFSGYDLRVDIITAADGTPAFNASYYTIPVVDAIRNASINRIQLLYRGNSPDTDELFSRRPDSRLEESFSAANVRGLAEQMSLRYDVDGDGRNDALYITENGTLAARRIDENLQIAAEPFWEYVSPRSVFEFEVLALNDDDRPDLMLRHGTTTTFLVARP